MRQNLGLSASPANHYSRVNLDKRLYMDYTRFGSGIRALLASHPSPPLDLPESEPAPA